MMVLFLPSGDPNMNFYGELFNPHTTPSTMGQLLNMKTDLNSDLWWIKEDLQASTFWSFAVYPQHAVFVCFQSKSACLCVLLA